MNKKKPSSVEFNNNNNKRNIKQMSGGFFFSPYLLYILFCVPTDTPARTDMHTHVHIQASVPPKMIEVNKWWMQMTDMFYNKEQIRSTHKSFVFSVEVREDDFLTPVYCYIHFTTMLWTVPESSALRREKMTVSPVYCYTHFTTILWTVPESSVLRWRKMTVSPVYCHTHFTVILWTVPALSLLFYWLFFAWPKCILVQHVVQFI